MQNIHEKKFESINDVRAQQSGESMPKKTEMKFHVPRNFTSVRYPTLKVRKKQGFK